MSSLDDKPLLSDTEELGSVDPEAIVDDIVEAAVVHSQLTDDFSKRFVFYGKSLREWADQLTIAVPRNVDQIQLREIYVDLCNNLSCASYFLSLSDTTALTLSDGADIKKDDLIAAIVKNFENRNAKRPAAEIIKAIANRYMQNTITTRVATRIVKNFWQKQMDYLIEMRKLLEQINVSLSVQRKYKTDELPYDG